MTNRLTRLLAATVLAGVALSAASAHAFSSLVVFGDSLSDSGNNADLIGAANQTITDNFYIPVNPYAPFDAYTNGNVWVDSFAAALGLPSGAMPSRTGGGNYAYGSARTTVTGGVPTARQQVDMYLATNPTLQADSLFVVAIGGNDVRNTSAATVLADAQAFAAGVDGIVQSLQDAGAGTIIVWTAPDVGKTPFAISAGASAAASGAAAVFNSFLDGAMADEANVRIFDIFVAVNAEIANPNTSFTNFTDACGAAVNACDPATALFWDGIHPTAAGHALISNGMLQVAAVPEPGSMLMMALGLTALLVVRRRA